MRNRLFVYLFCVVFSFQTTVLGSATIRGGIGSAKAIGEIVEFVFKKAGIVASKAYKIEAEHILSLAVKKYGDDVLKVVKEGGINTLNCGKKYGDDFWDLCLKYPNSVKILTVNADELLHLSKRIGPDFLKLEAKKPGITKEIIKTFGEDAVAKLAKYNSDDVIMLLHRANKAKSSSEKFRILMNFITPKNIIASGFVGGLLIVAMSIPDAIIYLAKEHPILFVLFLGALFLACSKNLRNMFWRFICSLFTLIRRKNKKQILITNSFPINLIRRSVTIKVLDKADFQNEINGAEIFSAWGHENSVKLAEDFLGFSLYPSTFRGQIKLSNKNFPVFNCVEFKECYIVSPIAIGNLRHNIGEELKPEEIVSWQLLKIEWSVNT